MTSAPGDALPVPQPPPLPLDALKRAAEDRLSSDEALHLLDAVRLGRKGWGSVHPNPMVGCVLVREGRVVGQGWHRVYGGAHAEVEALEAAGPEASRGATAYVSLEPCSHSGKTPPCTGALREAGVRRLVYGAAEPGSEAGGGGEELREAGLEVVGPVFAPDLARHLDPAFFHHRGKEAGDPYVALKLAMTLDGKISAAEGERTAITGETAERYTHSLRAGFDGVLVGAETMRIDDPLLTARGDLTPRIQPRRLILDSDAAALEASARLLRAPEGGTVHLFCRETAPQDRVEALEEAGVAVHRTPGSAEGVDLEEVLRVCWEEGIRSILCEGGGRVASSFLGRGLVNRLYLYVAARILGPGGVPAFPRALDLRRRGGWRATGSNEKLGEDLLAVFDGGNT